MAFNWKTTAFVLIDCALAVYLVLAVTAFNRPDEADDICNEVNIKVEDGSVKGFLDDEEIKLQLQRARLYPVGDQMRMVDVRKIEEKLLQNPFIKSAQCYKTPTGRVNISIDQRLPVIRVKADNGDDYYVDEQGNIMPNTHFASNLVIGNKYKKHAQKTDEDGACAATSTIVVATDHGTRAITVTAES